MDKWISKKFQRTFSETPSVKMKQFRSFPISCFICRVFENAIIVWVILFFVVDPNDNKCNQTNGFLNPTSTKTNKNATNTISYEHEKFPVEEPFGELYENVTFDGKNFRNDTPANMFLVPNIVHYIRWNKSEYSFVDYVCFRSAYINHKPKEFYIHTDTNFTGKWWQKINEEADWARRIKIKWLEPPTEIFGQNLSKGWRLPHGSDIERFRLLTKYGGIYFDNDVYVVQNLDYYRRFEMALAWDENQFLGTQVLLANKNARFLPMWLETYRGHYDQHRWYYNAGERPTVEVLYKDPSLVHRVKLKFGAHMLVHKLYKSYWSTWRNDQITIHLLFNHRPYLDKENYEKYGTFNETTIREFNQTFGEMAREVLPREVYVL